MDRVHVQWGGSSAEVRIETPFRKLPVPYRILPITGRSQALFALRSFGPWTADALAEKWAAGEGTLNALVAEGIVERVVHEGTEWCRLTEFGETFYE